MADEIVLRGNVGRVFAVGVSITPTLVAASSAPEQVFAVPGVQANDICINAQYTGPQRTNYLQIVSCRVVADNQVGISFANLTTATTPASGEHVFVILRPGIPAVVLPSNL
jgi:hypothetical protein